MPREEASVDIEDRGYQFADAIYEVIYFSGGTPFRLEPHMERLRRSASELDIGLPDLEELKQDMFTLQQKNGLEDQNTKLYLQVSRGTQERHHAFEPDLDPNVVMTISGFEGHPAHHYDQGVQVITVPDDRWARCYIKTTALISNGIAKTKAKQQGAFEAVFVRDGFITEGTSSNTFIVKGNQVITPPASNYILDGITRNAVIELVQDSGYEMVERGISLDEYYNADEVFLTGTTTEVMPVVEVDDQSIGDGSAGEITQTLLQKYRSLLDS
jgi:D-alanine transaminase